jgi:hypothetical protein
MDEFTGATAALTTLSSIVEDDEAVQSSYVPNGLIRRLTQNESIIDHGNMSSPISNTSKGICLIVDISGFTRLSGAFCAKGNEGIDGLQKIVNGYMGELVSTIYEYGGDVIKFAGDALICLFESSSTQNGKIEVSLVYNMLLAISCAWKLKDQRTEELTVHIGISTGDIAFGMLGGHENCWDYLISGPCLMELSQCLDDAPSCRICLTSGSQAVIQSIKDLIAKGVEFYSNLSPAFISLEQLSSGNYLVSDILVNIKSQDEQNREFGSSLYDELTHLRGLPITNGIFTDSIRSCMEQFVPMPVTRSLKTSHSVDFIAEIR